MRARAAFAAAVTALVAAAAWLAWHPEGATREGAAAVASDGPRPGAPPAPGGSDGDRRAATLVSPAPAQAAATKRTVFDEYLASRQYRALYDRLDATPEGESPKGRLVLYEILRECATVTGGVPWPFGARRTLPAKREDFIAGIAPNDPNRERRIAAYEQFTAERCTGLSGVTLSQEKLLKLLNDAAAAGEPAARALAIEQELWAARRATNGRSASPTDAQIQALQEAAASRDPEAIRVAGRVLANGWSDYALRVGPDEMPVEPRPFVNAWLVLACEYGAPCGPDTPRMLQYCALQGHCDAQSFPDHLAYYASSPHDSTLLAQYRALVRNAIESNDWSRIRILRGQAPGIDRQTFIPGPR